MNTSVFENYESNVRSYCRSFPTVFTTAKGAVMTDENGKDYIDFFAGAGALNYGHNPDYMIQKLVSYLQSNGIVHSMDMYTVPKRDFLEYFQSKILAPRGLNYKIQFAGPTGTNAVESAIKLARRVKGRENIFALMGAFHGMTLGSLSLTTDRCSRDGAGQCLGNVTHIPAPDLVPGLDTIAYMEMLLTDDHSGVEKPAAIVIETVQADGGINVFPVQWLKDLRTLCAIPKGLRYLALLLKEVVKSNIALTRMVYGRREPKPRLVTFRTPLEGNARCVRADSITLTPGTITGSIEENKMTVHALDEAFAEGIEDTDFQKALLKMQRKEERA